MADRETGPGTDMLKGCYREGQEPRNNATSGGITPPAPVAKSNRPDGDTPKPPRG